MKNLIIFVLALIALSSVFSVKLNKVLKEEKVLSVSVPNENLALKSETLTDDSAKRGDKDKDGRRKVESNLETSNEKTDKRNRNKVEEGIVNKVENAEKSLSKQSCGELTDVLKALEGTEGYDAVKELMTKNNC